MEPSDTPDAPALDIRNLRSRWAVRGLIQAALCLAAFATVVRPLHAQDKASSPAETLEKVALQLTWEHEFQFAGYYAAQLKGYYAEEGLEVEIRERNPDRLPLDAVLSGDADFGIASSDIVLLRMQGKPVVVLACIMQHSPWVLLVRDDSGISVPEDLVGKTVAMDMSYRDAEIETMFRNEGIPIEKIRIVQKVPGVERLRNGEVDARASFINAFDLEQPGYEFRVIRPVNYGIDFYGDTLFTSERLVRERPDRVAQFRVASAKGWTYAMAHPEEMADYILSTYRANLPPDEVPLSRERLLFEARVMAEELIHPVLIEIGHMNPERWRRIADTYAAMGMAEPIGSLEDFIYDPNPEPRYRWFYVALGLLMGIPCAGALARIWNTRLHRAVAQRTRELRESNQKHERLVSNLTETFLYRHDIDGVFNYVSSSVVAVLGRTREDFLTHFTEYLTDDPVNQEVEKHTEQSINGIRQPSYEVQIYHKDGSARWLEVSEALVCDDSGKVVAVEGIAHDITERKRVEEELEHYREHLEELVRERTQELAAAQGELVRKERLAMLGRLTGVASHDLRNPLGTVRNSLFSIGDALERKQPARAARALKLAERNIQRCDGIIDELLDYTRKRELKLEATDIDAWLGRVLDEQGFPDGIECIQELHSGVRLAIDQEHLRRAVLNAVTNAVQALQEENARGNRLTIETRVSGGRLELCIIDTGPGIPAEIIEQISEPLFTTKDSGVGLGVPIIHDIMKEHGGGVEYQSGLLEGTTVILWLPLPVRKE